VLLDNPLQKPLTVTPWHDELQTPGMSFLQRCPGSPAAPVDGVDGVDGLGGVVVGAAPKQQTLSEPPLHAPVTIEDGALHEDGVPQTPSLPFLQGCPGSPATPLGAGVGGGGVGARVGDGRVGAGVGTFKQQTLSEPPLHAPVTIEDGALHEDGVPQMPSLPFLQGSPGSPIIPNWSSSSTVADVFEFQTAASALRRRRSPASTFEPGLTYNNRAAGTLGQLAVFERAVEIVLKASAVVL
jgi:hypothetical protein